VVGAGATGGWFGARLALAGRDVTFLVRPARAALLREHGLRLAGVDDEVVKPALTTTDALAGSYDLVLLAVKATALGQALDDLAPAVGPDTAVVPFLNGMAHVDALCARFGPDRVLGGVVKISTAIGESGEIVRFAPFASMTVGELDGTDSPRLAAVAAALDGAGFEFARSRSIVSAMWHKWAFIAALGAVNCLGRGTVGEIIDVPGGRELAHGVIAETAAVAAAAGHPLPDAELAGTTAMITTPGSTLASSLYRDVVAGWPTEGEHLFGDLVARARELGVPVPLLDVATLQLRVHERRLQAAS
jgi:2-dehydropantoate 2-reductase